MSRRIFAASSIILVAIFLLAQSGCREKVSKWDSAQQASEGKTAAESSQDRLRLEPGTATPSQNSPTEQGGEDLGEIPPFNPDAATTGDGAAVVWKPKVLQPESPLKQEVDLVSLVGGDPLPGSEFNKYFPSPERDL